MTVRRPDVPLSLPAATVPAALEAGAIPIDVRDQAQRDRDGVILGALAIDADDLVDRLTPGGSASLRTAAFDSRWLVISEDGHDAEWLTWHLHARGVIGARSVAGGHRALRRTRLVAGMPGEHTAREAAAYSAH
ncbi:rhodanese-like domain-containing protein [Gordonia jinhuaensis]|uniref:rhodanese-like domain-containing protein n=1 Tax=Gordonia jinhuaensis TaxID=1517702 RepID=UPI001E3857D0|nr:rhodanese-like domain-containing protein [Gordonia jinhuaensis]